MNKFSKRAAWKAAPEDLHTAPLDETIDGTDTTDDDFDGNGEMAKKNYIFTIFDFVEMLIIAACALIFLFTFVARISTVEGTSMFPTLEDGDRLVVSDLFYTPQTRDIVVFQDLSSGKTEAIIKRIIATGGQTVYLDYTSNEKLTITVCDPGQSKENGTVLEEDYRYFDLRYSNPYSNGVYQVPEGYVFVMGDNTNNSNDSRGSFGCVQEEKILGRVVFRLSGNDLSDLLQKIGPVA